MAQPVFEAKQSDSQTKQFCKNVVCIPYNHLGKLFKAHILSPILESGTLNPVYGAQDMYFIQDFQGENHCNIASTCTKKAEILLENISTAFNIVGKWFFIINLLSHLYFALRWFSSYLRKVALISWPSRISREKQSDKWMADSRKGSR